MSNELLWAIEAVIDYNHPHNDKAVFVPMVLINALRIKLEKIKLEQND